LGSRLVTIRKVQLRPVNVPSLCRAPYCPGIFGMARCCMRNLKAA
jgi:hypothetical protein